MDLQSWAPVAAILAALLANFALTSRKIDRLEVRIDGVETKLETRIDGLEGKLETKIDSLETKLTGVERSLGDRIGSVESDLGRKIDGLREELRSEFNDGLGRIDTRLTVIEQRTYDLSTRLPPAPASRRG